MTQRERFFGLGLLLALNLIVYWPVLSFDFVRWDDDINITQNPLLTEPWSGKLLGQFFSGDQAMRFKPFHWLCFRLIHGASGFLPADWHAFNLGLHLAATCLFYLVLRQFFGLVGAQWPSTARGVAALLGAAVWSVHPLRVEAVAWATASTYPLTAVCLLASFSFYLKAHTGPSIARKWLVWSWVFAVLNYASYPVGLTYGLWLMGVDSWLPAAGLAKNAGGGRKPRSATAGADWTWWAKHACFLVPAALAMSVTIWARFTRPGIFGAATTVESVGIFRRFEMALASLTFLVGRLFWPVNLTPNMRGLGAATPGQLAMAVLALLVLLTALVVLVRAWQRRERKPGWALVCTGFAAISLPCLGLTEWPIWPVDRYSYVSHLVLVGGLAGVVGATSAVRKSWLVLAVTIGVAAVLSCAVAARQQTTIWEDSGTLFTHMVHHPDFGGSPRGRAYIYILWAKFEIGAARRESGARLISKAWQTYVAALHAAVGVEDYKAALETSADIEEHLGLSPEMRREKGMWLLKLGRDDEALRELRLAVQSMPDDPRAKLLLKEAEQRAGAVPGR